jgi:hypothetical protein
LVCFDFSNEPVTTGQHVVDRGPTQQIGPSAGHGVREEQLALSEARLPQGFAEDATRGTPERLNKGNANPPLVLADNDHAACRIAVRFKDLHP